MIKVERPPATDPSVDPIVREAGIARQALLDAYNGGQRPTIVEARYRAYKAALLDAFHGKCAYCDSTLGDTQHGHVEHYRPKNRVRNVDNSKIEIDYPNFGRIEHLGYFWLAYDWSNLLPACDLCNTVKNYDGSSAGKGDRFPVRGDRAHLPEDVAMEEPLLLDPTQVDPADHIEFAADGFVRGSTEEGQETIRLLGLNIREPLRRKRHEAYRNARRTLISFLNADVSADELLCLHEEINDLWEGRRDHTAHARLAIEAVRAHYRRLNVTIPMPLPPLEVAD